MSIVMATGAPDLSALPEAGSWLTTICGGLDVVDAATRAIDDLRRVASTGFVVVVVVVDDVVVGRAVVDDVAARVVDVAARVVDVVGSRGAVVVVVVPTE